MKITLDFRELDVLNLERLYPFCSAEEKEKLLKISGIEHYRMLCHLSTLYNNKNFISINAANDRLAAIALSYNSTNQVYSYDITTTNDDAFDEFNLIPTGSSSPANTHFISTTNFMEHIDFIAQSSIVFIGIPLTEAEYKIFYNDLFEKGFKGLVIVNLLYSFPETKHIWNEVLIKKIIVSRYGNWQGTGIIDYSQAIEFDVTSGGLHNNG